MEKKNWGNNKFSLLFESNRLNRVGRIILLAIYLRNSIGSSFLSIKISLMGMYNNKITTLSETNWSRYRIYHRENSFSDFYKSSINKLFFFLLHRFIWNWNVSSIIESHPLWYKIIKNQQFLIEWSNTNNMQTFKFSILHLGY